MAQSVMLRAQGLHTFKNQLSEIPEGALEEALNIVIDRDGVLNPRRGLFQYSDTFLNSVKQIREYKNRLISHQDNKLLFEDDQGLGTAGLDGTFTEFGGDFVEPEAGRRINSIEANSNFYFTTSEGVKKLSVASSDEFSGATITQSGGVKALNIEGKPNYTLGGGFFTAASKVAYRLVWGINDANDNLILGSPSARAVIENKDPNNNSIVDLTFPIPADITNTNYFYQIYRSEIVPNFDELTGGSPEPSEEYRLVFEEFVTQDDINNQIITIEDRQTVELGNQGAFLYTNPVSGQGIEQSNDPPPFAKDIELYKGYTFYANTSNRQALDLTFLGVPDIANGDKIFISDGIDTSVYSYRGDVETYTVDLSALSNLVITDDTGGTDQLKDKYFLLAAANDELVYKIWFTDTRDEGNEPDVLGTVPFPIDLDQIASFRQTASGTGLVTEATNEINIVSHGFVNNEEILYYTEDTAIDGLTSGERYFVILVDANTFQLESTIGGGVINLSDDGTGDQVFRSQKVDSADDVAQKIIDDLTILTNDFNGSNSAGVLTIVTANNGNIDTGIGKKASSLDSPVNTGTDEITIINHEFSSGDEITYINDGGTDIVGLTSNDQYFVIKVDENTFQLETTVGGGAVTLSSQGTGTHFFARQNIGDGVLLQQDNNGDGERSAAGDITATTIGATIDITSTAHGLITGETIIIETLNTTPAIAFEELVVTVIDDDTFQVTPTSTVTVAGTTGNWFINDILLPRLPDIDLAPNGPSTSQQIDQSARSLVKIINLNSSGIVSAFYISSSTTLPGQFFLEQRNLTGPQFNVYASNETLANKFNPTIGVQGSPAGFEENKIVSSNQTKPNRIYYSKFQQPEAVPAINFIDIGPQDEEIQRIVALRDSLFVFKEDGIYRLSGDIAPFQVAPFDFSLTLQAPDTAVVLNNQVHCFTTQGVAQITDTGVNIISRAIEDKLLEITREGFATRTASFGVSYETDRAYLLFTVTTNLDTVATQCFRYNSFTNTWTRWEMLRTCGLVNSRDDKMYLGAGDLPIIEKERKGLDRTDYADRQFDNGITVNGVNGTDVVIGTITDIEIGDALLQTQYLTISQYNRKLKRLDLDTGVVDTDYFSTLGAVAGDTMRAKVTALAAKLDLDNGVNDTDYVASLGGGITFEEIQDDYNIIVDKLNVDSGVAFVDYDRSEGTTPIEAIIIENLDETEGLSNTVRLNFSFPLVAGLVVHYKSIKTNVIYAPQVFGDPTIFKQVNEGTYLFEDNNFTLATVGYKSDLSPSFENITFNGDGIGDWGQFNWSGINWGGISSAKPLRTYIPRQKQRCRFLQPQFIHNVAFEKYSLFGISLTFRPYSTKAYK